MYSTPFIKSIPQLVFDQVLALEYNSDMDKLFVLVTKRPVTSSVVALCVIDVPSEIDKVFDESFYKGYNEQGAEIEVGM